MNINKAKWLKITNPILLIVFMIQVCTGLAMYSNVHFLSLQVMFELHKYNGLLLTGMWLIHLMLNWSWIRVNYFKKKNEEKYK